MVQLFREKLRKSLEKNSDLTLTSDLQRFIDLSKEVELRSTTKERREVCKVKSLFIQAFIPHIVIHKVTHNVSDKVEEMLKYQLSEPSESQILYRNYVDVCCNTLQALSGSNTGCPDSILYNLIMSERQKYASSIWFNGFPEELRCGNLTYDQQKNF